MSIIQVIEKIEYLIDEWTEFFLAWLALFVCAAFIGLIVSLLLLGMNKIMELI